MKIEAQLDHSTILANQRCPVHLALELTAPFAEGGERRPMAFCAILDRSGSMAGRPLAHAKAACEGIIRNLRSSDQFALVTFDDTAEVVLPIATVRDKARAIEAVRRIQERGCTNLCAGWMLGRDELRKTVENTARRTLLLSDGLLNRGIIDQPEVSRIVSDGLERSQIRTSTLGFGDGYDENFLEKLATGSGGNFYDANSAEKLPAIFEAELEGLQRTACQNVRVRIRKLDFCESWSLYAAFRSIPLPDGRVEISLGDLTSEESATMAFHLDVLPLPMLPDGTAAATLEGERLLELEILWDDPPAPRLPLARTPRSFASSRRRIPPIYASTRMLFPPSPRSVPDSPWTRQPKQPMRTRFTRPSSFSNRPSKKSCPSATKKRPPMESTRSSHCCKP